MSVSYFVSPNTVDLKTETPHTVRFKITATRPTLQDGILFTATLRIKKNKLHRNITNPCVPACVQALRPRPSNKIDFVLGKEATVSKDRKLAVFQNFLLTSFGDQNKNSAVSRDHLFAGCCCCCFFSLLCFLFETVTFPVVTPVS